MISAFWKNEKEEKKKSEESGWRSGRRSKECVRVVKGLRRKVKCRERRTKGAVEVRKG